MENEQDLVVFEDDNGNQITMEVLDYLSYEGKEYALLAELSENDDCEKCESQACEACENRRNAYVMQIVALDDDMEEFVPVDEALAEKLIDIFENSDFDEEEYLDEEDEEGE